MAKRARAKTVSEEPVEGPWELPDGWRWERLSAVTTEPERADPRKRFQNAFRYLDVSGINGPRVEAKSVDVQAAPSRARQIVQPGDTILSGVRVYLRNVALIHQDSVDVASTAFSVLRPSAALEPRFLHRWITSDYFISTLLPLQRGNSPPAVLDGDVREQAIPVLEDVEAQGRLMGRVDALFAEIDEGERALAEARAGVETYRKTLLKAAVTGELTADWRARNPARETGEALLHRFLADRHARWEAAPKNRGRRYVEPQEPELADLPDLPESWCWASIDQIISDGPTNGYSPKASTDGSGTSALKLTATSDGRLRLDTDCIKTLSEAIPATSSLFLQRDDLLFQRGNTKELVGISAVYDGPPETYIYPDLMIRVRTLEPQLTHWLWRWANSPHGRHHLTSRAQGAAGSMPKISGATLRVMPVPLCSRDEMAEALSRLDHSQAPEAADSFSTDATTLRQSILAAAFRGYLTAEPQP